MEADNTFMLHLRLTASQFFVPWLFSADDVSSYLFLICSYCRHNIWRNTEAYSPSSDSEGHESIHVKSVILTNHENSEVDRDHGKPGRWLIDRSSKLLFKRDAVGVCDGVVSREPPRGFQNF